MSFVHGKDTYVSLDGNDLSGYTNASEINPTSDSHDTTTYGKQAHTFQGGLGNGTAKISGIYDNTAGTGPRAVIKPLVGSVVPFIHRPEGTGSGKPQDSMDVLVLGYTQSSPVADMVTWSADLQISDVIDDTAQ
jgi:hypothetical protein